jgi:hypothetical protein
VFDYKHEFSLYLLAQYYLVGQKKGGPISEGKNALLQVRLFLAILIIKYVQAS